MAVRVDLKRNSYRQIYLLICQRILLTGRKFQIGIVGAREAQMNEERKREEVGEMEKREVFLLFQIPLKSSSFLPFNVLTFHFNSPKSI